MKLKYRMYRSSKSGYFYWQDNETRKQGTLATADKREAQRLLNAKNESYSTAATSINLQIARAYLNAADPKLTTRTWQEVMDTLVRLKRDETYRRWSVAIKDKNYDSIRQVSLLETRPDHFLRVLEDGKVSTNVYLRRIHNFALAMDWLLRPVIPKAQWPTVSHRVKRAITLDEHQRIVEREQNPERRAFYWLCWYLGGSQKDIAELIAEDVDWGDRTLCYDRHKLQKLETKRIKPPLIHFGTEVVMILKGLPHHGPLFPNLCRVASKDRANEFRQRCQSLCIKGVSLHSYRYAWAERARKAGYPERFAQEALGHNSKAVHRAYARKAQVRIDSLQEWERKMMSEKVTAVDFSQPAKAVESVGPATIQRH